MFFLLCFRVLLCQSRRSHLNVIRISLMHIVEKYKCIYGSSSTAWWTEYTDTNAKTTETAEEIKTNTKDNNFSDEINVFLSWFILSFLGCLVNTLLHKNISVFYSRMLFFSFLTYFFCLTFWKEDCFSWFLFI